MYRIQRRRRSPFNIFDDLFDNAFTPTRHSLLKTDIKEKDKGYELIVDVPGMEKEDIKITLENGYLCITAKKTKEEEVKEEYYLRKERTQTGATRRFYVGERISEEDIKAKLENGVLTLEVPKEEEKVSTEKVIEIR
ncbi:MAG: Hsp20 family protein [Acholeplasmataceae bacterium]|jgi:HSP20 family molecular chaperone IbpA|nr:Hsp20 family protein [Acholeplasmataceae bacterium]